MIILLIGALVVVCGLAVVWTFIANGIATYQETKDDVKKIKEKMKKEKQHQDKLSKMSSEELKEYQEKLKKKERVLSAGTYRIGRDIPAGTYNIIPLSGFGNIETPIKKVSGTFPPFRMNNVKLDYGDVRITGKLKVKFEPIK